MTHLEAPTNNLTTIYPVAATVAWQQQELATLCQQLIHITKSVEFRTKNLQLAIKSIANKDKKTTMENNLSYIFQRWQDNCRRLGVIPIGIFRCKILISNGPNIYWEYPKGLITPPL